MIKNKSDLNRGIEIDLTGPDGNAFVLLRYAEKLSRELGLNFEEINEEMTMSDYENLVETFDKYFGEYITLLR